MWKCNKTFYTKGTLCFLNIFATFCCLQTAFFFNSTCYTHAHTQTLWVLQLIDRFSVAMSHLSWWLLLKSTGTFTGQNVTIRRSVHISRKHGWRLERSQVSRNIFEFKNGFIMLYSSLCWYEWISLESGIRNKVMVFVMFVA